jgi:uncharacterized protein (TIGR00661 family)
VYDWVENQYDLLNAADIVVSRAGHGTIVKSIVFGKPMILIPIPDHTEQYGNARRASRLGLATILPQKEVNTKRLLDATERLLKSPRQAPPASEGVERAADEVVRLAMNRGCGD